MLRHEECLPLCEESFEASRTSSLINETSLICWRANIYTLILIHVRTPTLWHLHALIAQAFYEYGFLSIKE